MNKYIKLMALVAVISNVQIAISADQDTAASETTKTVDTPARETTPARPASPRLTPEEISQLRKLLATQHITQQTEANAMPTSPRLPASPASDLDTGTPAAAAAPANTDANSSTTSEPTTRNWFSMPTMPALRMPTAREAAIGAGVVVTAAAIGAGVHNRENIRNFVKRS